MSGTCNPADVAARELAALSALARCEHVALPGGMAFGAADRVGDRIHRTTMQRLATEGLIESDAEDRREWTSGRLGLSEAGRERLSELTEGASDAAD